MKIGLRNVSIGWRIAMALALPTLAMLGFALWSSAAHYRSAQESGRVRAMVEFATVVNALVHTLQTERGLSTAHVTSGNADYAGALSKAQAQTDQVRARFVLALKDLDAARLSSELDMQTALARQVVDRVDVWRGAVAQRSISVGTLIQSYAGLVADLTRVVQQMLVPNDQSTLARTLAAYSRLMQAKEFAGLERAVGVAGFTGAQNHNADGRRLIELIDRQSLLLDEFRSLAGPPLTESLDRGWSGLDALALDEMRQAAVAGTSISRPLPGGAKPWLEVTTRRIDALRAAEERVTADLLAQAQRLEADAFRAAWWIMGLTGVTLLASLLVAAVLARDIIRPLERITRALRQLASHQQIDDLVDDGRSDEIGDMVRAIKVFKHDLTRVVQAEAELKGATLLRQRERYQRALLDSFPFEVWLKDTEGRFLAVNQALAHGRGGQTPDALVGMTEFDLLDYGTASTLREEDLAVMQAGVQKLTERSCASAPGNAPCWVETYRAPVTDDHGALLGTVGFSRDITERYQAQEEIRQLALYDPLTKLPNRRLLSERLNQALASARRDQTHLALIFVDLDKFKPINDSLGHNVGDLLLYAVAQRLQHCVREVDTAARLGGDEFVVLLPTVEAPDQAVLVAEKIRHALNQPFELAGGHVVSISSSSGVAIYPDHGEDEITLSKAADAAMYRAKALGRNNVQLHQSGMPVSMVPPASVAPVAPPLAPSTDPSG
jgi:diguanylate cyclase (GGDEF)-like protein/PAS domain S-box-containing protein